MSLEATSEADISPSGRVIISGSEEGNAKNRFGIAPTIFAASPHLLPSPPCHTCEHIYQRLHILFRNTEYTSVASDLFISGETELVVISVPSRRQRNKKFSLERAHQENALPT